MFTVTDFNLRYICVIIFLNLPQEIELSIYTLPPIHLSSYGQAERAVQIIKLGMKSYYWNKYTYQQNCYWSGNHVHIWTLLCPVWEIKYSNNNRAEQKAQHNRNCTNHSFQTRDSVFTCNFRQGSTNDSGYWVGY